MDEHDTRNELLMELIGKMQDRLADKEYPGEEKPPVEETVAETIEPAEEKEEEAPVDEELSDEDLAALEQAEGA